MLWFVYIQLREPQILKLATLLLIYFAFLGTNTVTCDAISHPSDLQKLRKDLMTNYDKDSGPTANFSNPTKVKMLFDVQHIIKLDEKTEILTIKGILMLKWMDDHLVWDPKDYGGLEMVRFTKLEIWQPEIYLLFSEGNNDLSRKSTSIIAYHTGVIKWYPRVAFDVPCTTHLRKYPFDVHNCTLHFGSWRQSGEIVSLQALELPLNAFENDSPAEWKLREVSHRNELLNNGDYFGHPTVTVHVSLKRVCALYVYVYVLPAFLSALLTLTGFWLPASDPCRFFVGCSNTLMMTLFLMYVTSGVPAGNEVPIIVKHSAAFLCMASSFVLITVAVLAISRCSRKPPSGTLRNVRRNLDNVLCLTLFTLSQHNSTLTGISENSNEMTSFGDKLTRSTDWLILSLAVDRLVFYAFFVIYVILISVLSAN